MTEIERCTKRDFDGILAEFERFWDDDATLPRHHVMFVREFGDSAWVVRSGGRVVAYMFAFLSQNSKATPYGYVHMVAVDRDHRRAGLARRLYLHFVEYARSRGCRRLRATVAPANSSSIAFHRALGMEAEGRSDADQAPAVRGYGGPGIDRVVFSMDI